MYCEKIADYDKLLAFKVFGTLFTGKMKIKGLAKGNKLEEIIRKFCKEKNIYDISDFKMKIAIPTVDLNTGEVIYYLSKELDNALVLNEKRDFDDTPSYKYKGDMASIVRGSCSFPAVFEPKWYDGKVLIDGGVRVNTPVSVLKKMGAEKVIAVTFSKKDKCTSHSKNIVSIALRSFDIMGHQVNESEVSKSDLNFNILTEDVTLLDGSKTSKIATQGYEYTKKNIGKIKRILEI